MEGIGHCPANLLRSLVVLVSPHELAKVVIDLGEDVVNSYVGVGVGILRGGYGRPHNDLPREALAPNHKFVESRLSRWLGKNSGGERERGGESR